MNTVKTVDENEYEDIIKSFRGGRRRQNYNYNIDTNDEMPPDMAEIQKLDDIEDDDFDFNTIIVKPYEKTAKASKQNDEDAQDVDVELMGKRRIPTDEGFMQDGGCDAKFYAQLQLKSNRKNLDGKGEQERYIKDINVSKLVKEFKMGRTSFYSKLNKLIEKDFLIKEIENGEVAYKLVITKGYYMLVDYRTLENLVNWANSDTIKLFLLCKSYHKKYGQARLDQHQILEQLGYPVTRKYLRKVEDIIMALQKTEFLKVTEAKEIRIDGKKAIRYYINVIK